MQIRSKWLSVRYEHGVSKIDILKWVLLIVLIAAVIIFVILIWNRKLKKESVVRLKLIGELEDALNEIKTLKGIVPICSNCKKIRDDKGYWNLLEIFIEKHSEASFSHGICPECSNELYGKEDWYIEMKKEKGHEE
ncbi:MAG: ABC transporter ATP-binding protein [archaeon]|nr:ABC transporter ATP-binding protein [archaeon]